jgi:hypothetical protein
MRGWCCLFVDIGRVLSRWVGLIGTGFSFGAEDGFFLSTEVTGAEPDDMVRVFIQGLQAQARDVRLILQVDAIRFLYTFRNVGACSLRCQPSNSMY